MASCKYDPKAGKARLFFRFDGRQFNKTIKVKSERAALALCETIEETITDLERGRLLLPPDADLVTFFLSGGTRTQRPENESPASKSITLTDLFGRYRADPPPHLESTTRKMQEVHFRRLQEVFPIKTLTAIDKSAAQAYVTRRAKQSFRGKPIQRETIAKELKTLRQAWAWVATQSPEVGEPPFVLKDLSFPKGLEKSPFMSWEQIEREVSRGGLTEREIKNLWNCLWLERHQVRILLDHVREAKTPSFLYPMVCAASFTGARRSELCRSRISDWQFENQVVRIRQKKRDKHKEFSFRDIRLHPILADVMKAWFAAHPGGQHAFCLADARPLTVDAATHHFNRALRGSKWEVVRGWHVLRHSFASNLAAAGKEQRIIDKWMGHSTDVRWRYQHLRPKDEQDAIDVL